MYSACLYQMKDNGTHLDVTPAHIVFPSFTGTTKARRPRSSPLTMSLAQTTAIVGKAVGTVGGMNLRVERQ